MLQRCTGSQLHEEAPEPWHVDREPGWRLIEHLPEPSRLALARRSAYPVDIRVVRECLEDAGARYWVPAINFPGCGPKISEFRPGHRASALREPQLQVGFGGCTRCVG